MDTINWMLVAHIILGILGAGIIKFVLMYVLMVLGILKV